MSPKFFNNTVTIVFANVEIRLKIFPPIERETSIIDEELLLPIFAINIRNRHLIYDIFSFEKCNRNDNRSLVLCRWKRSKFQLFRLESVRFGKRRRKNQPRCYRVRLGACTAIREFCTLYGHRWWRFRANNTEEKNLKRRVPSISARAWSFVWFFERLAREFVE